jgi:NADH-quinone oxidoreductase subunit I
VIKPNIVVKKADESSDSEINETPKAALPKIPMKPKIPTASKPAEVSDDPTPKPKVVIRPKIQVRKKEDDSSNQTKAE